VPGFTVNPVQPCLTEFMVHCPTTASEINEMLLGHDILGGYDLGNDYPDLKYELLIAVTEMTSRSEIDYLVAVLEEEYHD